MRLVEYYSHLNGYEWLQYHKPHLWTELTEAIASIDADAMCTKVSKEKTMQGKLLLSPSSLNKAFEEELISIRGWKKPVSKSYFITDNADLTKRMIREGMDIEQQRELLELNDKPTNSNYRSKNEADFEKERVSIEVQLGKYAFVQYDIFVKHAANYMHDRIDLGIQIVPMKEMEMKMSSGPSNYERNLHELLRQGRIFPPVPIILVGIAP